MKNIWIVISLTLVLTSLAAADSTHVVAGGVFGAWTKEHSPYVIEGDVTVPDGQTLKIGPQVKVYFAGHHRFIVHGKLYAETRSERKFRFKRNNEDLIRFTTDLDENPAGWGGIRIINAEDVLLNNCIIEHSRSAGDSTERMGGAIYVENSRPTIVNCVIRDNMSAGPGGAIAAVNSNVTIANCSINDNTAGDEGGALYGEGSELELANISIDANVGGGIRLVRGQLNVANCSVSDNVGVYQGGGLYVTGAEVTMANASISGNAGGGLALTGRSELTLANCSIHGNRGASQGGGIFCANSSLTLANSSINDNATGGVYAVDSSDVELTNCSVRNNEAGEPVFHDATSKVTHTNTSIGN